MTNKATEYFKQGYNCSQSVFLAYAKDFGIDNDTALKLSSSFGGGMGRLREVCGAVSAMFAIAGLKYGYTNPNDNDAKCKHYQLIQNLANKFKEKHSSIICKDLLGNISDNSPNPTQRSTEFYQNRPCLNIIETVCELIENL